MRKLGSDNWISAEIFIRYKMDKLSDIEFNLRSEMFKDLNITKTKHIQELIYIYIYISVLLISKL